MTGLQNIQRLAIATAFAVLTVMALAPAAGAQAQDTRSGWERTTTARGESASSATGSTTVSQQGPGTSMQDPRGWEATSSATQRAARITTAPSSPDTFPVTSVLLYLAAGLAALIVAFGVSRMVRPNRRPPRVA